MTTPERPERVKSDEERYFDAVYRIMEFGMRVDKEWKLVLPEGKSIGPNVKNWGKKNANILANVQVVYDGARSGQNTYREGMLKTFEVCVEDLIESRLADNSPEKK